MRKMLAFVAGGALLSQAPLAARAAPELGPPLVEDAAGRRAIRGAPAPIPSESPELRALRDLEAEAFPQAPLFAPPSPTATTTPTTPPPLSNEWLATLKLPDLPVRFEPHTVRYLELYLHDPRGRAIMSGWLRRQGRYRALIEDALARYHLPHALLYVSMIESGYDPLDRSGPGAVGLWQFMPEGARIYGLRVDHWVDERRNPERATEAAMHYLSDLKARFGSWPLALAAFNAGYGAVLKAAAKYNTNDYWELCRHEDGMPWETTLYVPKATAAAVVGENRAAFGYADVVADPAYAFDRVSVPTSTSFAAIARAASVPVADVQALNPELVRGRTPPEPWTARVPKGAGPVFAANFDKARERVQPYVVRFGERLDEVAHRFGMSRRALERLNGLDGVSDVHTGLTLVVPDGAPRDLPPDGEDGPEIVAVPDRDLALPGRTRVFYRALPTDTLAEIAAFFHVGVGDLARWNNLDPEARLVGRIVLQVFVASGFDTTRVALLDPERLRVVTVGSREFFDLVEAKNGRKRLTYTVKAGDTLKRIGAKFKLSEADLERINRFGRSSELRVGQKITVYVAMSPKERAEAERTLLASRREGAAPEERDIAATAATTPATTPATIIDRPKEDKADAEPAAPAPVADEKPAAAADKPAPSADAKPAPTDGDANPAPPPDDKPAVASDDKPAPPAAGDAADPSAPIRDLKDLPRLPENGAAP